MKPIIEFIERFGVDPQVYLVCDCVDKSGRCEVFGQRDGARNRWRLRRADGLERHAENAQDLLDAIEELGVDSRSVRRQFHTIAMMQIVFAKSMLDEAMSVFGAADLDNAVFEHERFVVDLQRLVSELTGPTLSVVTGGSPSGDGKRAVHKSGLSLVR